MDNKKAYFMIGKAVPVMALAVALLIGSGCGPTEAPSGDTTTSAASESAQDNGEEATDNGATVPDVGETKAPDADSDGSEGTSPGGETSGASEDKPYEKGDITEDGRVYYPDFDLDNTEDLDEFIKEYSPREDVLIVRFADGPWDGLVSREGDVVQVVKRNDLEQIAALYFDDGSTIVTHEKYDEDGALTYRSREDSSSSHTTESYFEEGVETRTVKYKDSGVTETLRVKTVTVWEAVHERLIYVDTGKGMIQSFEYADFTTGILSEMTVSEGGKTYTWNMDGVGNDVENIVSLTVDGKTIPRNDINLTEYTTPPGRLNHY